MVKFNLKKERLNFTAAWTTPEKNMVQDGADEDLLLKLLDGDTEDGLDRVIQSIEIDED